VCVCGETEREMVRFVFKKLTHGLANLQVTRDTGIVNVVALWETSVFSLNALYLLDEAHPQCGSICFSQSTLIKLLITSMVVFGQKVSPVVEQNADINLTIIIHANTNAHIRSCMLPCIVNKLMCL
jgi:hypothetical protein